MLAQFFLLVLVCIAQAVIAQADKFGDDTVQILSDGDIVHLEFSEENAHAIFSYQAIDPSATFTLTVYPDENANEAFVTYLTLSSGWGVRPFYYEEGYFTIEIKTKDDPSFGIDMVENPIYIQIEGVSGIHAYVFAVSSIVLKNEQTVETSIKNTLDGYDWAGNNYMRYFRVFACDDDDEPEASGTISFTGKVNQTIINYATIYINRWKSDKGDAPGRPDKDHYDMKATGSYAKVTKIDGYEYPGWVFIGVDFSGVLEEEDKFESDNDYTLLITAELEKPHTPITKSTEYSTDLCFYEDCYEFASFDPREFVLDSDRNSLGLENLYFLVMINDKFIHEHQGIITLEAMSSTYYDPTNLIHKYGTDNYMMFDSNEIENMIYLNLEMIYVSITTTNMTKFMQPIPGISVTDPHLHITSTLVPNGQVVRMGEKVESIILKQSHDWDGTNYYSKTPYGARLILDTAGVNKPGYLVPEYADGSSKPDIVCDYIIDFSVNSNPSENKNISAGIYIGNGYDKLPRMQTNDDGQPEDIKYTIKSTTLAANTDEKIKYDTQYLRIEPSDTTYYQDGAYILDVFDTNYSGESSTISVDVAAHPFWQLYGNEEYYKKLNAESTYDYFIFKTTDISHGVSIYVELIDAVEASSSVGLYASFINPFANEGSPFKDAHHYYATIDITEAQIINYSDLAKDGSYTIFFAVNTLHTGQMKVIVSEGANKLTHLNDGHSVEINLPVNGDTNVVMFHSSEENNQSSLFVVLEGLGIWTSNVRVRGCIYPELITSYDECIEAGGWTMGISSSNNKHYLDIGLPTGASLHPDYFIHLQATATGTAADSVRVSVFAEDYDNLNNVPYKEVEVNLKLEPVLFKMFTIEGRDYTLKLNLTEGSPKQSSMKVRICKDYPALSRDEPEDVIDNTRYCDTRTLVYGDGLTIDIVGDRVINDGTQYDDLDYILSEVKFVSIYPDSSSIRANIHAELYEDVHVRVDSVDKLLSGKFEENNYFRLLILSADSVNKDDMISIQFKGDVDVHYCISNKPHTDVYSDDCKYKSAESPKVKTFNNMIKLSTINESYTAQNDEYVYFTYYFPYNGSPAGSSTSVRFSNSVVHYLPLIETGKEDIKKETFYFEMFETRKVSFYTSNFVENQNLRFFVIPDVVDYKMDDGDYSNTASYSTALIGMKYLYNYREELPTPTFMNFDAVGAGIMVSDKPAQKTTGPDGSAFVATTIMFVDTSRSNNPRGLYKAGFIDLDGDLKSKLASVKTLTPKVHYNFAYDLTRVQDNTPSKASLFYYPYARSDMVVKVYPCAGIPGVNTSFVKINPTAEDRIFSAKFPQYGYTVGNEFEVSFMNYIDNGEDMEIDVPTGFIFNATFERGMYLEENDPDNNTRWDGELVVVTGSGRNAYGGPRVFNRELKVKSQRGAEVVVEFAEALSGYEADPSITETHIEYAVYAIPAPNEGSEYPTFDASPLTHCGLMNYGFPLTVDSKKNVKWTPGKVDSNADGSNTVERGLDGVMQLTTNFKPVDFKYSGNFIINRDGTTNKNTKRFNINVVAREIQDNSSEANKVIGYSVYRNVLVEISGSLPITPGGLLGWEVALIILAIIAVVAVAVAVGIYCFRRKRQEMGYGNLDGHGNAGKQGLNVDLPDDDLSISASSSSSRPDIEAPEKVESAE